VQLRYIYLEDNSRDCIRRLRPAYAYETTHPRSFVINRVPPEYSGTVFTQREIEARHVAPHARNLREISRDGPTTHEGRKCTLNHLLEHFASRGMNAMFSQMSWPHGHVLACKLAPRDMEIGSVFHDEDGADVLLSHGVGHDQSPPIMCGIDIKSQARHDHRIRPTYSIRLGGPVFDIYAGSWPLTPDTSYTLHDAIQCGARSNESCRNFLSFMERNIGAFGRFMTHRFASRLFEYEAVLAAQSHVMKCKPEIASMYPRQQDALQELMTHVSAVNGVFRDNGFIPHRQPRYMQNQYAHLAFLPQTPLP